MNEKAAREKSRKRVVTIRILLLLFWREKPVDLEPRALRRLYKVETCKMGRKRCEIKTLPALCGAQWPSF